jgi:CLIP-associating protein 1/2
LQAAQRAKVRAQYAAMARNKISSGTASLRKFLFVMEGY